MLRVLFCVAAMSLLLGFAQASAQRREQGDWPCPQRLLPSLTAGTFWSGPDPDAAGDWKDDHEIASLVRRTTPRRVTAEEGEAALGAFADGLKDRADRSQVLTRVFAGLLQETNREREALIQRIKELARRQRELADIASEAGDELRRTAPDGSGEAAARRDDLEQRFAFVTRAFEGGQRTMRYLCEAPVQLEARLGRYARALQARL
jgi:hypothetical protein